MILGRVVGTVVATRKDDRLVGAKLLVVRTTDPSGKDEAGHMPSFDTALDKLIANIEGFDVAKVRYDDVQRGAMMSAAPAE